MKKRLTKRAVEAIKPGDRDTIVWDSDVRGFGLKVTPKGKRAYFLYYRTRDGTQRRLMLGTHGDVTCDQARTMAESARAAVANGQDPSAEKQAAKKAETVAEFCDWFYEKHLPRLRPRTAAEYRRLIEKHVKPALGKLKVRDVTPADVAKLHRKMGGRPRSANQTVSVLSKMMTLAVREGMRSDNPCRSAVDRYPERERNRFLSDEELTRLGAALAQAETEGTELPGAVLAIRLLALTGRRLNDIRTLRWEYVDLRTGCLHLPETKTGPQEVTLGATTVALLSEIDQDGEYVVYGNEPGAPLETWRLEDAWRRIRKQAGIPDARLHDLRHTVGTYAGQAGANAFLVRDKLGHKTLAMTGRYVGRDSDPVRELSNRVEARIDAALNQRNGDVVPLRGDAAS